MLIPTVRAIRQKPKEVRDQYAFGIAIAVTTAIAVPWLFNLSDRLNSASDQTTEEGEAVFSSFFTEAGDRLSNVTDSFDSIREPSQSAAVASTTQESSGPNTPEVDMSFITNDSTLPASPGATVAPREVRIATTSETTTP